MEQLNPLANKCRKYSISDIKTLNEWYAAHRLDVPEEDMFPEIGYLVPEIGCGFIYQTDSSLCFIDGYISNPESTGDERRDAFDIITQNLLIAAKEAGFRAILAYTENMQIKKRCERYDFNKKGTYDLYVRGI